MIPRDDCFYNEQYRAMFIALQEGIEEGVSLTRDMFRKKNIEIDYDHFVNNNSLNLDYREYVGSLIRLWQLRQIIILFNDANKKIKNTYSAGEAFIQAHDTYTELKSVISIIEDANGVDALAGRVCDDAMIANNSNRIIKTHIQKVDSNIHLRRGGLYLLSGKAKSGKTTLALNMVRTFCKNAKLNNREDRVVFVSLEMSAEDLMRKLISMESGISELQIFSGTAINKSAILKASEEIATWNLDIIEGIGLKISDVYAKLIPIIEQKKVSFVVLDHFTALSIDENARSEIERNEIKAAKLGNMVKILNICMILIAHQKKSSQQYSKKEDDYDEPREEDIAGYGALEKWISGQWVVYKKKDRMYDDVLFLFHFWWRYCKPVENCVELRSDMSYGYIGD